MTQLLERDLAMTARGQMDPIQKLLTVTSSLPLIRADRA